MAPIISRQDHCLSQHELFERSSGLRFWGGAYRLADYVSLVKQSGHWPPGFRSI
jgi:hypothetical protein